MLLGGILRWHRKVFSAAQDATTLRLQRTAGIIKSLARPSLAGINFVPAITRLRVWNENPKRGDSVTWSGARDTKDYVPGFGRIIRFIFKIQVQTGSGRRCCCGILGVSGIH